jgi:hypothetical protein
MRVQPRQRQARRRDAEPRQPVRGEIDDAVEPFARELGGHRGQRHMDGGEHHFQRLAPEHHRHPRAAGEVREQVRVPLPRQPRARERQFVHRRGRHGVHRAGLGVADRGTDRVERGAAGVGRQLAHGKRVLGRRTVEHRFAHLAHAWIVGRLARDLGSDAGRVADGNRDARFHV